MPAWLISLDITRQITMSEKTPKSSPTYPSWVQKHPVFALELLNDIHSRLKIALLLLKDIHSQPKIGAPLERQHVEYLCDAIATILGDRLTKNQREAESRKSTDDQTKAAAKRAAKALYLVLSRGQKSNPLSERNTIIYNDVQKWIEKGQTAPAARMKAAEKYSLSEKAIEKICAKIDALVARSKAIMTGEKATARGALAPSLKTLAAKRSRHP